MLTQEKNSITKQDILEIIKKRENEDIISFEEVYYDVLKYNPSLKNV